MESLHAHFTFVSCLLVRVETWCVPVIVPDSCPVMPDSGHPMSRSKWSNWSVGHCPFDSWFIVCLFVLSLFDEKFFCDNVETCWCENDSCQYEHDTVGHVWLGQVQSSKSNSCQSHEGEVETVQVWPSLHCCQHHPTTQNISQHDKNTDQDWTTNIGSCLLARLHFTITINGEPGGLHTTNTLVRSQGSHDNLVTVFTNRASRNHCTTNRFCFLFLLLWPR